MALTINTNLMALNASRNLASQYAGLTQSARRLSSGLRVGTAADDAAGLAIRELMRADIAAFNQGVRNTNDAISAVQTADGALQIIDEKLIRMKELAEQAATGTYDSTQRLMIDSEFQAMAAEIQRIATATNFNGIKLLDGSLSGSHDGSGLVSKGALKVHFGPGNDSAEDYYYLEVGDATLQGLGLTGSVTGGNIHNLSVLSAIYTNPYSELNINPSESVYMYGVIPQGSQNVLISGTDNGYRSLQVFTASGRHLLGTSIGSPDWIAAGFTPGNINDTFLTAANGFDDGATYNGSVLNGVGGNVPYDNSHYYVADDNPFSYNGMNFGFTGDGNPTGVEPSFYQAFFLDEATEDLIVVSVGTDQRLFSIWSIRWDYMPASARGPVGLGAVSIQTQQLAQEGLERVDEAIVRKDKIRAHLGATQNRLENTATNLNIQAENLLAAESRISDADVALEMTEYIRKQILAQAGVAMLAQANSLPRMALQLVG